MENGCEWNDCGSDMELDFCPDCGGAYCAMHQEQHYLDEHVT